MTAPRLYIATRDPRIKGGVPTMAQFVYGVAKQSGFDPCLVANAIDGREDVRLTNLHDLRGGMEITHTTEEDMEVKLIPRILPEIEITQYVFNRALWREALSDGDVFYGVGGNNQCCLPLVREQRDFGAWIATTFWEDRYSRLESASVVRRVRDVVSKPCLERLESKIFRNMAELWVLSHATKRSIVESYDVAADVISVVPYPVDTVHFSPGEESLKSRPTVLFVGRINDKRKNVGHLIKAFARVIQKHPDARLKLIGEEPSSRLERIIDSYELSDNVEFVEFVPNDELPEHYRKADVFCIPSHQEGLAIVGLEAMSCGTPVVSTRCGGPEDYVLDGQNGFLVPRNDEQSLAVRLTELLANDVKRESFGENARSTIESDYARADIQYRFQERFEQFHAAGG